MKYCTFELPHLPDVVDWMRGNEPKEYYWLGRKYYPAYKTIFIRPDPRIIRGACR